MEDMAMEKVPYKTALIADVGPGISASRASSFGAWVRVGLAARDVEKIKGLAHETGANTFAVVSPTLGRREAFPRRRAPTRRARRRHLQRQVSRVRKANCLDGRMGHGGGSVIGASRDDLHRSVKLESSRTENKDIRRR